MKELESHPAAKLFPMMEGEPMKELAANIRKYGLINSIVLHDGLILDGRNRHMACALAGIEPHFTNWDSDLSPTEWVLATNLSRRHLTMGEKINIAVCALPMLEAEARSRMEGGVAIVPQGEQGKSRDKAAELTGVSSRYVSDAKKLKETAPEKYQEVIEGKKTLPAAVREVKAEQPKQEKPPTTRTESYKPENGITFAKMAISQLERIHAKDTQREDGFELVIAWVNKNRS